MSEIGIADVLAQMRVLKAQAQNVQPSQAGAQAGAGAVDFSALLKSQVDKVNEIFKTSGTLSDNFVKGVSEVSEVEVMVSLQKASVAYQALNQVRNKLLSAYQEVMSMSV